MAAFGVEGSGDIAGVAGVGTGGNAQSWQSLFDWFFPMGVFGVGGPGAGFNAPNGGYGVCGLGYSPSPLQAVPLNPEDAVGVYGQGGAGNSTGVVGVGTGSYPGISGIADPNQVANGTGVVGRGGLSTGIGVWGSGGSEHFTATPPPGNAIGVFGAAGSAMPTVFMASAADPPPVSSASATPTATPQMAPACMALAVCRRASACGETAPARRGQRRPHHRQGMRSACSEQAGRVTPTESTASAAATAMVANSPADLPQCASFRHPPAPGTRQVLLTTSGSFTSTVTAAYSTAEEVEPLAPGLNWLSSGYFSSEPTGHTRFGGSARIRQMTRRFEAPGRATASRGAPVLRQLYLSGAELEETAPGRGQEPAPAKAGVEWHPGQLYPRVGFIVTNLAPTGRADRRLLQPPRHLRAVHQRGQERDQVDPAVVPFLRRQCGSPAASCPGVQPWQFHADAGDAQDGGAVVADQSARKADPDRRKGRQPWPVCDFPDGRGRCCGRCSRTSCC
jgi:hypothetical protein